MANTYSGDPSTSDMDRVRFLISDTADPWLFTNEEIVFTLSDQGGIYQAAEELALVQSTKYTDKADKTVGPLSIKYGEVGERWLKLAQNLRRRSGRSGAIAVTTQVSRDPHIRLGMHDIYISTAADKLAGEG